MSVGAPSLILRGLPQEWPEQLEDGWATWLGSAGFFGLLHVISGLLPLHTASPGGTNELLVHFQRRALERLGPLTSEPAWHSLAISASSPIYGCYPSQGAVLRIKWVEGCKVLGTKHSDCSLCSCKQLGPVTRVPHLPRVPTVLSRQSTYT